MASKTERLIAEWKVLQPLAVEAQKKLEKKFRLEFNYNSNHIEGNTLTYGETELLLLFDDTKGGHTMREYEEMKAHDIAWQMVTQWAREKERPLTEQAIKNLNEVILVRPFWKEAITPDGQNTRRQITVGNYKQPPNSVRLANGEIFDYASPMETPALMQELVEWYRSEEGATHPVTLAAMLHYKFVRIHPFDDGNGRLVRLLMNYVLLRNDLPPVIIKSADKQDYLRALHIADTGDHEPFIGYIAKQLEWSLQISLRAAKGESIEEEEDWKKRLHLLKGELGHPTEVTLKKGKEAFEHALKNIILPVLKKWEIVLHEFDSLFNSRKCFFALNTHGELIKSQGLVEGMKTCFDRILHDLSSSKDYNIEKIKVNVEFQGLRAGNAQKFFDAGELILTFYENVLQIDAVTGKSLSVLYSEILAEDEADAFVNELANRFAKALEEWMNGRNENT